MHDTLVATLAPREGEEWLDLGCGAGDVAFRAARAGATVTGSDSPTLIETARSRADELGLDLTLEVGDCQELEYADASFDVVSSSRASSSRPTTNVSRPSWLASADPAAGSG